MELSPLVSGKATILNVFFIEIILGTLLQLRARLIQDQSSRNTIALEELVLSPSRSDPAAPGHVVLVSGGCSQSQFREIVPSDPWSEGEAEVRVNFEAVMLDVSRGYKSNMWIHVTVRSCKDQKHCQVNQ